MERKKWIFSCNWWDYLDVYVHFAPEVNGILLKVSDQEILGNSENHINHSKGMNYLSNSKWSTVETHFFSNGIMRLLQNIYTCLSEQQSLLNSCFHVKQRVKIRSLNKYFFFCWPLNTQKKTWSWAIRCLYCINLNLSLAGSFL